MPSPVPRHCRPNVAAARRRALACRRCEPPPNCTSGSRSKIPRSNAPGSSTPRTCGRTIAASTARAARACSTLRRRDATGLLQLRRPLRRRRRRADRGEGVRATRAAAHAVPRQGGQGRVPPRQATPIPTAPWAPPPGSSTTPASSSTGRVSPVASAAPAHRRPRGRRAPARLEAQRVLAGADAARAHHRRQRARDVTAAGMEAARLGRRRRPSSTGGAPRRPRPSAAKAPVYVTSRDEIVELVGSRSTT